MPTGIISTTEMLHHQGNTLYNFGKDTTGKISYTFNQQGFRSSVDYNFKPKYAFFGCSLVFGIGVSEQEIFPSKFTQSHNYGLAGKSYSNSHIFNKIEQFVQSDLYDNTVKLCVVWADRPDDPAILYYKKLKKISMIHFFCGQSSNTENCFPAPKQIDFDVSNSHPGILTHRLYYKILCSLFNQ